VWPSGISLGEAHLHSKHSGPNWDFTFNLEVGVPGFPVKDTYRANTDPDYCSISFGRTISHGSHLSEENETVDRDRHAVTRTQSKSGAKTDIPAPACVKDALTYLFYSRFEMGQGRVPAAQDILFGNFHAIRVDYTGAPMITVNGKQVQTDMVTCTIEIGTSRPTFDVYFARDAARTPLRITAPLPVGKLSMELIR
jgi:hypothetical protein